jgi:hypothetical protein
VTFFLEHATIHDFDISPHPNELYCDYSQCITVDNSNIDYLDLVMKMGVIALKGYLQAPSSEVGCIPNLEHLFNAGSKYGVPIILDINLADERLMM